MDVLCSDKTGTLTLNKLTISEPWVCDGSPASGKGKEVASSSQDPERIDQLIMVGAMAAKRSGDQQDAIDAVICDYVSDRIVNGKNLL